MPKTLNEWMELADYNLQNSFGEQDLYDQSEVDEMFLEGLEQLRKELKEVLDNECIIMDKERFELLNNDKGCQINTMWIVNRIFSQSSPDKK